MQKEIPPLTAKNLDRSAIFRLMDRRNILVHRLRHHPFFLSLGPLRRLRLFTLDMLRMLRIKAIRC
jgi:hypothetical protein